jgi:hypothetical protein
MKIRDKIIFSFLSVIFLLFVVVLVKIYSVIKTKSLVDPKIIAVAMSDENGKADDDRDAIVNAYFAKNFKFHIQGNMDDISINPSDGSALFLLHTCRNLKGYLLQSLASIGQLPHSLDSSFAVRESNNLISYGEKYVNEREILYAKTVDLLIQNPYWKSWKGVGTSPEAFIRILSREPEVLKKLAALPSPVKTADKAIIAFGEMRFSRAGVVVDLENKIRKAVSDFSKEVLSTGVGAAPDIVADLNDASLSVLAVTNTEKVREEWADLLSVFDSIPLSLPAAGVNNLIDSVLESAEKLRKQWKVLIKARLQHLDILEKGQWIIVNYKDEVSTALKLIQQIEESVISDISLILSGSAGIAEKLAKAVTETCESLPDKTFASFKGVTELKARAEAASWRRLYHDQLGDLTFLLVILGFGCVLAVVLGLIVYRDVSNPLHIIKNSLNNLSMGGDKRRINLKIGNEFGGMVEAYNRYLDNLTSAEKRMIRCPDCTSPYEMGDVYCRSCGRPLRCNL